MRFYGGQYGVWTRTPSPSWQFTVVDAVFERQREVAIREETAGLTLIYASPGQRPPIAGSVSIGSTLGSRHGQLVRVRNAVRLD